MRKATRWQGVAVVLLLTSVCAPQSDAGTRTDDSTLSRQQTQSTPVVSDAAGAAAQSGREVLVQGIARDAKLGAAVVNATLQVYCLAIDRWPAQSIGLPIVVRGQLQLSDEFVAPDDPTATGTEGPVWVLRDCRLGPD